MTDKKHPLDKYTAQAEKVLKAVRSDVLPKTFEVPAIPESAADRALARHRATTETVARWAVPLKR